MTYGYKCDTCGGFDKSRPWPCPDCGQETCEHCFSFYALCKQCCKGKTIADIRALAIAHGWDAADIAEDIAAELAGAAARTAKATPC